MVGSLRSIAALGFMAIGASSCAGANAASHLARAPDYQPNGQSKCDIAKSQARPLVVEWPSSDRLQLETKTRQGLVAVRYVGCEMSVLERCSAPGAYRYLGGTRKQDTVELRDADDLYANLPVGAARLEGILQRSGKLTVSMSLVGRFEAERPGVRAADLQGDCAGATHFVYGVTVGAFDFYAGGDASVGGSAGLAGIGGGAHSGSARETLTRDGDAEACAKATPSDKEPPAQCGAPIRLEVVPLTKDPADTPVAAPAAHKESAPTGAPPSPIAVPPPAARQTEAPPGDAGHTQRVAGLVVGGAGGVAMIVGVALAAAAKSSDTSAQNEPGAARQADSRSAVNQGNVATGVFFVGTAAVATGLVLWFTAPGIRAGIATDGHQMFLRGAF